MSKSKAAGEIRQSQLLTTYGPGALVDLPDESVIVGGLEHWHGEKKLVHEERLVAKLKDLLKLPEVELRLPPVPEDPDEPGNVGIVNYIFPAWFVAQHEGPPYRVGTASYRTRPIVHWKGLVKGGWQKPDGRTVSVVPIRFVQACRNGHIDDVDWRGFVHHEKGHPSCFGQLWLDEGGTGGDLAEIYVRCDACKKRRGLSKAKLPESRVLGDCRGKRPWLGPKSSETCVSDSGEGPEPYRLLPRSATHTWFAQNLSVISIPDGDEKVRKAVDLVYEGVLKGFPDKATFVAMRGMLPVLKDALGTLADDVVWAEVERRKPGAAPTTPKTLKQVEIETFQAAGGSLGEDTPEGDFYARRLGDPRLSPEFASRIERVVLIHRLREVSALLGFTRFEPPTTDVDGELSINTARAAIAEDIKWLPAGENRGEGVFIGFRKERIEAWLKKPGVIARGKMLEAGFAAWKTKHKATDALFPGLPYYLLHALSHLLVTAVSLECGYASTSIKERIYARPTGYGILLYTGTPGSEGTLGGLVEIGRDLNLHLRAALELGRLCSNDPVCAHHKADHLEERFLHGAACHGCLLIAETSCERRNELLDRALVVPVVGESDAAFFDGEG